MSEGFQQSRGLSNAAILRDETFPHDFPFHIVMGVLACAATSTSHNLIFLISERVVCSMIFMDILTQPLRVFRRHSVLVFMMLLIIVSASLYPSDLENDYAVSKGGQDIPFVVAVEDYGRHINTLLPFAMALVLRDKEGLKQLGFIAVAKVLASHGPKRLLINVEIMGTRLG